MSEFLTLQAKKRIQTGKGFSRRLRASGRVPAVFYTSGGDNLPLDVNERELQRVYQSVGRTTVFNVEIDDDGSKKIFPALFWDVDYYPTKNRFQHVDIFGVDLDKEVKTHVPLVFVGTAPGTKVGGTLEAYIEIVEVSSKPLSLPQKIVVDVSGLELNQHIRISDISLPDGVRIDNDPSMVVVAVVISKDTDEEGKGEGSGGEA